MDYPMTEYISAFMGRALNGSIAAIADKTAFTIGGDSTGVSINLVSQLNTGLSVGG